MEKYGKWEVIKKLGEGGQGTVYLVHSGSSEDQIRWMKQAIKTLSSPSTEEAQTDAVHSLVNAVAQLGYIGLPSSELGALKVLHKPREPAGFDKAKQRMKSEVEALTSINHPSIIKIIDHKLDENWFVCEYFPKGPLSNHPSLFKGNTLGALTAFRQLVEGLRELHSKKCVHRDIKPANVFVAEDDRLVLGDLGLVFFADENRTRVSDSYENVGSRDWMPPWAHGTRLEDVNPTFDLFGLGKLLWAMLSGRTILRLWYHNRPEYSLEKMFPDDDSIAWANVVVDRCVVENEENCIEDTDSLLKIVDDCLRAVKNRAQRLADDVVRHCTVCGFGSYKCVVNENERASGKFGLRPDSGPLPAFKIFSCDFCGHSQIFYFPAGARPSAWAKP